MPRTEYQLRERLNSIGRALIFWWCDCFPATKSAIENWARLFDKA
jgi:hypothetical protein